MNAPLKLNCYFTNVGCRRMDSCGSRSYLCDVKGMNYVYNKENSSKYLEWRWMETTPFSSACRGVVSSWSNFGMKCEESGAIPVCQWHSNTTTSLGTCAVLANWRSCDRIPTANNAGNNLTIPLNTHSGSACPPYMHGRPSLTHYIGFHCELQIIKRGTSQREASAWRKSVVG